MERLLLTWDQICFQDAGEQGDGVPIGGTRLQVPDHPQTPEEGIFMEVKGISMEAHEEYALSMIFEALPGNEAKTYHVEIAQYVDEIILVGGVAYEIHTPATPVIKQVYYNTDGPTDDNQFLELWNPYEDTLYLDGIAIGIGRRDDVATIFRFPGRPGDGRYSLPSKARLVLARDAVDDFADVEMGYADWEFHTPNDDFDNPRVPNLEQVFGEFDDAELPESGGIFISSGTDNVLPIHEDTIMDGMNYSLTHPATWVWADTRVPEGLAHPGCSSGESLQRVGSDTNRSADDFRCDAPVLLADIAVELTLPAQGASNGQALYNFVYRNDGPVAAKEVAIELSLPNNTRVVDIIKERDESCIFGNPVICMIDSVKPDDFGVVDVEVILPEAVPGERLPATLNASHSTRDADNSNNSASGDTLIEITDMAIAMYGTHVPIDQDVDTQPPIELSESVVVTYTILIQNLGGVEAPAAIITDDLPSDLIFIDYTSSDSITLVNQPDPLVWEVGRTLPGDTHSIVLTTRTVPGTIKTLVNSVEIMAENDGNSSNNQATTYVVLGYQVRLPVIMRNDLALAR